MALEGSIKDFGIADIFQLINLQKKSGILTIQDGEDTASINFYGGEIVYAVSNKMGENEKIGRLLITLGKLSEKELEDALIVQQNTGEKIGHILTAIGAISENDLKEVLQTQIKDVIFQTFRWKNGWYKFDAQEIEYEKEYQVPIPTDFILMEGIRMLDEWPYIESHIPSEKIIFSQSIKGEEAESLFSSLTPEEMNVFNLIDGQRDIRKIEKLVNLTEFEVFKNIAALKAAGLIEEVSPPPLNPLPQGEGRLEEAFGFTPPLMGEDAMFPSPLRGEGQACTEQSRSGGGELRPSPHEPDMSGAPTEVYENQQDEIVQPAVESGIEPAVHEEKLEKGRIWTAVQIAILIFIVSSIFIFFSIGEIGGFKDYYSAYNILKKSSAIDEMTSLRNAIIFYRKANGKLPESLESLYQEHFISEDNIIDPWKNNYVFELLPQGYRIYSKGPDGLSDSSDDIK